MKSSASRWRYVQILPACQAREMKRETKAMRKETKVARQGCLNGVWSSCQAQGDVVSERF